MTYTLKVKPDPKSCIEWTKTLNQEEYEAVKGKLNGRSYRDLIFGMVLPVRTDIKGFAKDFFFPTVVNYAFKVQNIVLKIFAAFIALAFDVPTFFLRFIFLIPRFVWNIMYSIEKHPFHEYLKLNIETKNCLPILNADCPFVRFEHVNVDRNSYTEYWQDGYLYRKYNNALYWDEQGIQLIEKPQPDYDVIPKTGKYPVQ